MKNLFFVELFNPLLPARLVFRENRPPEDVSNEAFLESGGESRMSPEEDTAEKGKKPKETVAAGKKEETYEAKAKRAAEAFLGRAEQQITGVTNAAKEKLSAAGNIAGEVPGVLGDYVEIGKGAVVAVADAGAMAARIGAYEAGRAKEAVVATGKEAVVAVADAGATAARIGAYEAGRTKEAVVATGKEAIAAVVNNETVQTAVGLGIMARNKVGAVLRGGKEMTGAAFSQCIDWGEFGARYVRDGVVDNAKLMRDFGKDFTGAFATAVGDSIDGAREQKQRLVKYSGKIYDIGTSEGLALAKSAEVFAKKQAAGVERAGKEAIASVANSAPVLVMSGLGFIVKDKVKKLGREGAALAVNTFNDVVDWGKLKGAYVVNGVVDQTRLWADMAGEAAKKGIDFAQAKVEFVKLTVATTVAELDQTGKHWLQKGKNVYDTTTAEGRAILAEAKAEGRKAMGVTAPAEVDTGKTAVAQGEEFDWTAEPGFTPAPAPKKESAGMARVLSPIKTEAGAETVADTMNIKVGINNPSTMWGIMEKYYGKGAGRYWEALAAANDMKIELVDGKPYPQKILRGQDVQLPKTLTVGGGKKQLSRYEGGLTDAQIQASL